LNIEDSASIRAIASFAGINKASNMIDSGGRQIAGAFYPILKPFLYILNHPDYSTGARHSAVSGINNTDIPVMLVQGTGDAVVTPDREAITNFAGEITNPNVEILLLDDEWNRDHIGVLMWSRESYAYRTEVNETLPLYRETHNIEVFTDDDLHSWAEEVRFDRVRINGIDTDLFNRIDEFFKNAIPEG
jgi:hypothetical protein